MSSGLHIAAASGDHVRAPRRLLVGRVVRRVFSPLLFVFLAALGHLPALISLSTSTQCACQDAPQTDWFLAWTPWAISHGVSPWYTDRLLVPDGVNLTWNTILPLPALLAWPITSTLGPLAAHTLLAVVAFAGSASAMWWAVGRWATWGPARFAAGLLYGFSPYLVAQGSGHLNLSLVMLPPVFLRVLDDLLVRGRRRAGWYLGLVALAQFLITEEVLASAFVICVCAVCVLLLQRRPSLQLVRSRLPGLAVAAAVLSAGAAWPLATQFFGHGRLRDSGPSASPYDADVFGAVIPTIHQVLGTDATQTWGGNPSENGSYLGAPLLAVVALLAWRYRQVAVIRFAAVLGFVAWLLSLGDQLHVAGSSTGLAMPFAAIAGLPVFDHLTPVRFSLYVVLCAALVLGVGLDRLHATGGLRLRGAGIATAVCLASLLPAWPYDYFDSRTPAYFTTDAVDRVPNGSVAVTYPFARFPDTEPMLWQADAGLRYRTLGGYVISPQPDGSGTFYGGPRTRLEQLFAYARAGGRLRRPTAPLRELLVTELRRYQVDALLVPDKVGGAREVVAFMARVLGRPPDEHRGGVSAWYDLRGLDLQPGVGAVARLGSSDESQQIGR